MGKQRIVLLYHIEETEKRKLENALSLMGVRIRVVPVADYLCPIGALLDEPGFVRAKDVYRGLELPEPMMIMSGFDDRSLDNLLRCFQSNRISPISLKAIATPSNQTWNSLQLYLELKREHASMH